MKRVNYVNAIIIDEETGKILLVRNGNQHSSYWSFPGGGVEGSESLEQALVREVQEETGFIVQPLQIYSVREVLFMNRNEHALIFTFTAKIAGGELAISDPDHEILEARWMDIRTANQLMPYIPEHMVIPEHGQLRAGYYHYHGEYRE